MRKFILTDADSMTALGQKLEPGKLVQDTRQKYQAMTKLIGCGSDTPLLAVLTSSLPAEKARLYQINCWTVSRDPAQPSSYTVIKEITPVPPVRIGHKMAFGLEILRSLTTDRDFKQWAQSWLEDSDRLPDTARALLKAEEKEKQAAGELEALTAWGESGTDDHLGHTMDECAQRCHHLIRAAVLFPDPAKTEEVNHLIAQSLANIGPLVSGKMDLSIVAEKLMYSTQAQVHNGALP